MGLSGNAQVNGSLVVSTLSVTGNAGAFQLSSGASSDYVASTSNWITNGVLTVAVQDDTGNGIDPSELDRHRRRHGLPQRRPSARSAST